MNNSDANGFRGAVLTASFSSLASLARTLKPTTNRRGSQARTTVRGGAIPPRSLLLALLASVVPVLGQPPPVDSFDPGANDRVLCFALEADGSILVGGHFTRLAGVERQRVARILPNGMLESNFPAAWSDGAAYVACLGVQTDGGVLLGGAFDRVGNVPRRDLARIAPGGGLDLGFDPGVAGPPNASVQCLAIQADGKIVIGGVFTSVAGQPRTNLARLHPDGSLDADFAPAANSVVFALAPQPDGKLLVGGSFTALGGPPRARLGRLHADGTLEKEFQPNPDGPVNALALQPDGRIWVGGTFTTLAGETVGRLARLRPDGALDHRLASPPNGVISTLALQADGGLLAGGWFTEVAGQPIPWLFRLEADGSVDGNFRPGGNGRVAALAVQPDGSILVGGAFTELSGQPRGHLGRLQAAGPVTDDLDYDHSGITWQRAGGGPEFWRTTFEATRDGVNWWWLGEGEKFPGGWRLAQGDLLRRTTVRARGQVVGGQNAGSVWWHQRLTGFPLLTTQPQSRTNLAGTTATFSVTVGGADAPSYQWWHEGTALEDGPTVTGARTAQLTLSDVLGAAAGRYQVEVNNRYGQATSAVARLTVVDPWISVSPTNVTSVAGGEATLGVTAIGTAPLSYQWRREGTPLPGATEATLTLTDLQPADPGRYDVLVTSPHGSATSAVATLTANFATVDEGFNATVNGPIIALAPDRSGRILAGGYFTTVNGQGPGRLARFHADGSRDWQFNPAPNAHVRALAALSDGRVVVSGAFSNLAGWPCRYLGRLRNDGQFDVAFGPEPDALAECLVPLANGKLLAGGAFTRIAGQPRALLARFNPNGTWDATYAPQASGRVVNALAVQADGKVLAGGDFQMLGGANRSNLARLNPDGTADAQFDPGVDGRVLCLALQADGRILVGGEYSRVAGQPRTNLARLNPDGSLDTAFDPGPDNRVTSILPQADGMLLLTGFFNRIGGHSRHRLARLHPDGRVDLAFVPATGGSPGSVAVEADGRILVGGTFIQIGGQARTNFARLRNTAEATQRLEIEGDTVTWWRGGTSPELWRTTLEASVAGGAATVLREGERIAGGWRFRGIEQAERASLRAGGQLSCGGNGGSAGWVEAYGGLPWIAFQPVSRTNLPGTTAVFTVITYDTGPYEFQWLRDGAPLADGGRVAGARTPALSLSQVEGGDAGGYWAVVSSAYGSVTSAVATLTVLDPWITTQPVSLVRGFGETAVFRVDAAGSPPLSYQWRKEGIPLDGQTRNALTIREVEPADLGAYDVVVTSSFGAVTSVVAHLTASTAWLDPGFIPAVNSEVFAAVALADGKVLVGSGLTSFGGQPRAGLGRLNADGSVDAAFDVPADGAVTVLAVQTDGKIVVGGQFNTLDGRPRSRLGRLHADGTLDDAFNPGPNYFVNCLAVQADGKLLVGGQFTSVAGQQVRHFLVRLHPDGSLDSSFNALARGPVYALALQPDGRILVGGSFAELGGLRRTNLGRVNPDGTGDAGFFSSASSPVLCLALQADGRILAGGGFTALAGQTRLSLGRLHPDGALDTSFAPPLANEVRSVVVQADGKLVVGGNFLILVGQPRGRLARLNSDGSPETNFEATMTGGYVNSIALQPDGRILAGGFFQWVAGQYRPYLARLDNLTPATQELLYDGARVTWARGGTSPEVWRTTLEYRLDGGQWTPLGDGERMAEGWRWEHVGLPVKAWLRARGHVTGGQYSGSTWWVESPAVTQVAAPLRILTGDPAFGLVSNHFAFHLSGPAGQVVVVEGSTNLTHWLPLRTNVLDAWPLWFRDPAPANQPAGFYRARAVP